ncbi:MAG: hypothetical protein FJ254_08300, partial [Phycisphaerae bacterium]|nr:hypothetical protein [Phycisphaerae bacterium]
MSHPLPALQRRSTARWLLVTAGTFAIAGGLFATIFPMTPADFHVPGSQVGDLSPDSFLSSNACSFCHAAVEPGVEPTMPHDAWKGSLMAQGGRDPLFFAQ